MSSLQQQVDEWQRQEKGGGKRIKVIGVDESEHRVRLSVDGHKLCVQCPSDADECFEIETSASPLQDWQCRLAAFAFEEVGLTLVKLLNKAQSMLALINPMMEDDATVVPAKGSKKRHSTSSQSQRDDDDEAASMDVDDGLGESGASSSSAAIAAQSSTAVAASADDDWGDDDDDEGDGFGDGGDGDGGGDDDWGGFTEETAEDIHDDEWERVQRQKKKMLAKADELRRKHKPNANLANVKNIFTSDAAATMLVNDAISYMNKSEQESGGIRVHCDENPFIWNVRLSQFPKDSKIHAGLHELSQLFGYDYVELEIRFMMDLYPFYPPSVRLVRPRMKHFMIGRLVSMSEIQLSNWRPTRTVSDILDCVRRVLTKYGEIDDELPELNDPDSGVEAYSALEFDLLRLSKLTGIAPRVLKTMPTEDEAEMNELEAEKKKKKKQEKEKADAKAKATPKGKADKAGKSLAPAATSAADSSDSALADSLDTAPYSYSYTTQHGGGFKKGTGYGGGHAERGWDAAAWKAAQLKKDSEIAELARSIANEFHNSTNINANLASVLAQSCLVPFLARYVGIDSLWEAEQHAHLFHMAFDMVISMCSHPLLIPLVMPLKGEAKSLQQHIDALAKQARMKLKLETGAGADKDPDAFLATPTTATPSSSSASASAHALPTSLDNDDDLLSPCSYSLSHVSKKAKRGTEDIATVDTHHLTLTQHIILMAHTVEDAVKKYQQEHKDAQPDVQMDVDSSTSSAAASSSSFSSAAVAAAPVDFCSIMGEYRFGEVESFDSHHYQRSGSSSNAAPQRAWIKRLASEYTDLSKSLPINPCSSVYLRYLEDKMGYAQFIVAAPDETPYGFGLFLFDAMFPPDYPNSPPKVNLATTGSGSVRFNPNLYNCGKVCLSLLGTWSGAAGENWTAATSTFLQVAVSIQSLIFVAEPYFNEPGYQSSYGTAQGKKQSDQYNSVIEVATIKYAMIEMMRRPPSWARDLVRSHFCLHRDNIMAQCRKWSEHNSQVKSLLPQLETELDKQTLPDGSKLRCNIGNNNTTTAATSRRGSRSRSKSKDAAASTAAATA